MKYKNLSEMILKEALEIIKDESFKSMIEDFSGLKKLENDLKNDDEKCGKICEVFPEKKNIFRSFSYFKKSETRVVIMGQDPYHTPGMAMGLCFGVSEDSKKIPPSLRNILRELREDLGKEMEDNSLESWAKQGVLLLNAALTVREKSPGSHMKYWKSFTKYVIEELKKNEEIVWVAWGAFADKMIGEVKHKIVSSHPSPLSYKKKYKNNPEFFGSRPFSKINNMLEDEISW